MDIKALSVSQLSDRLCYSSQTDQFYLENKGKYFLEAWGNADPKDRKRESERMRAGERERERACSGPLAPLFICFFLPLGLPYVTWASQEYCLFYPRSSLGSLDLPLFYFWGLFPFLSFSYAILDSFFLLWLRNSTKCQCGCRAMDPSLIAGGTAKQRGHFER